MRHTFLQLTEGALVKNSRSRTSEISVSIAIVKARRRQSVSKFSLAVSLLDLLAFALRCYETRIRSHTPTISHQSHISTCNNMFQVSVAIVGPGLVGSALISQIQQQASKLQDVLKASISVVFLANSRRMLFCPEGVCPEGVSAAWKSDLNEKVSSCIETVIWHASGPVRSQGLPVDLERLGENMRRTNETGCCVIVVRATNSKQFLSQ